MGSLKHESIRTNVFRERERGDFYFFGFEGEEGSESFLNEAVLRENEIFVERCRSHR